MNKNMSDTLPVICENAGRTIEVAMGTTLLEVERQLRLDGPHPFLAAYVNNRIKELNYRIYKPVTVRFIDITSFEGIRVYQRTISFILQGGQELFPDRTLYIRHSLGQAVSTAKYRASDRFPPNTSTRSRPACEGSSTATCRSRGEDAHRHGPQNLRRVRNGR